MSRILQEIKKSIEANPDTPASIDKLNVVLEKMGSDFYFQAGIPVQNAMIYVAILFIEQLNAMNGD